MTLRVLIAEDHPINRLQLSKLTNALGWQTSVVENGRQAIIRVKQGGIDLVLMDCFMPDCDGFTAAREIRAFETEVERSAVPMIAISASSENRTYALAVGMDDFIAKPVDKTNLLAAIARIPQLAETV
jgi:CheY-like chemotaxis protein